MSIQAHLAELEKRHRVLEAEIAEAQAHPSIDDLEIVELKRRKLLVKDEIARLQLDTSVHCHCANFAAELPGCGGTAVPCVFWAAVASRMILQETSPQR